MKSKLQQMALSQIIPYWRNPRRNENAVAAVRRSIELYGYCVPIIVDRKQVIICGHTRYKALTQLGVVKTFVLVSGMTEEQAREYRIADNKTHENAGWIDELLQKELQMIEDVEEMAAFFDNSGTQSLAGILGNLPHDVTPGVTDDTFIIPCPHCGKDNTYSKAEVLA